MHHASIRRVALLVLTIVLLCGGSTLRAVPAVQAASIVGEYNGFFQSQITRGLWGYLRFSVDEVSNRRWIGSVQLIIPAPPSPIPIPFPVVGTIAASGEFTGKGESPAGSVLFHGL